MCDLIDLKSPEVKTVGPKLASPLIPAPPKSPNVDKNETDGSQASSGLNYVKRKSVDNNPFDNALHKTAEYLRKQEDPFEIVLEKALEYDNHNDVVVTPKARNVEFKDDFTYKKFRYSDVLKMNKTLDDSTIQAGPGNSRVGACPSSPCANNSVINDLDNTDLLADRRDNEDDIESNSNFRSKNDRLVPKLFVESPVADTSILNRSAMNDSLTDSGDNSEELLIKSMVAHRISMCIRKGTNDANSLAVNDIPKSSKLRRSLSQGDGLSPRKFRQQRSQSIVDSLKASIGDCNDGSSVCSFPSMFFEDSMNKAFLQSQRVDDVSNISNLSAITRLASVSSACNSSNSSSAYSNRTVNRAFVESSAGDEFGARYANRKTAGMSKIRSTGSISSMIRSPMRDCHVDDDISDLLSKYSELKMKETTKADAPMSRLPSIISGSGIDSEGGCERLNNKLIDVDVFVPLIDPSPPVEQSQTPSISSSSSDSVFTDGNTIGRSILSEAKSLAKTFEEMARKTSGSSNSSNFDDLINSRPQWNFDMLPVSDDEALIDNLIELPNSPIKIDSPKTNNPANANENESSSSTDAKSKEIMIKELETEFIDPEKKIHASSLLMDLEKLVKSEGNPKAIELLENLEKTLGVKTTSNSELLASCFVVKNDLTKSPKRSENTLETDNITNDVNEKSCEDNANVESSDIVKKISQPKNDFHENLNDRKIKNIDDKSTIVDKKFDDVEAKISENEEICDNLSVKNDDSIEAMKQRNHVTYDPNINVEFVAGLRTLLSGFNENTAAIDFVKNLGVLMKVETAKMYGISIETAKNNVEDANRELTPVKKRLATPPRKSGSLSAFNRSSIGRRSLESSSKNKSVAERALRKSISMTGTPVNSTTRISNNPMSADRNKSHLKETKKRFSSDPCFVDATIEKKKEFQSVDYRKSNKDITVKSSGLSELSRQDKPSSTVIDTVKNKLRKKTDSDGASKRGPMKAVLPLGNMQRQVSSGKRISPSHGSVTPPKHNRDVSSTLPVTTSTPFPIVRLSSTKKSPKTKPMASSTPDSVATKNQRRSAPVAPSPGKNTLSCDISPVTSKTDDDTGDNLSNDNSKSSKASKICTPTKSRSGLQLPKLSPMLGIRSSPKNSSRGQRRSEPLQSFLPRSLNTSKSPSIRVTEVSSSPHNNTTNKLASIVKPLNHISKLRRRGSSIAENENYA